MQAALTLATVALTTFLAAGAAASSAPASHVRGLNAAARELLETARSQSAVLPALIEALEATDVVALVTLEPLNARSLTGYLTFVSAAGGVRYVQVKINWEVHPRLRVAVLAHELQHALEVAAARDVHDVATLLQLYKRIGYEVGPGKWETDAARSVGDQVLGELSGHRNATIRAHGSGTRSF